MIGLLKADFYRLFKSKLFYILIAIALFFALAIVPLSIGVNGMAKAAQKVAGTATYDTLEGKAMLGSIFGLSSNMGLIFPIFAVLLVYKDVSDGTIRNKVISGNSRTKIFFSHYIVLMVLSLALNLMSAGITSGLTFLAVKLNWVTYFNLSSEIIDFQGGSIFFFYIIGILTFTFLSSLVVAFSLNTGFIALPIIFVLVIGMGMGLLSQLFASIAPSVGNFKYIFYAMPSYPVSAFVTQKIDLSMFLSGLGVLLACITLTTLLGCVAFNKRDMK